MSSYEGTETIKPLEKLNKDKRLKEKDKRLKEIADRLRSATGSDRDELLEERDNIREANKGFYNTPSKLKEI